MSIVFPNSYMIAKPIQNKLQELDDAKEKIRQDLWTLVSVYNDILKKKILTFPETPRILREESKDLQEAVVTENSSAKAKPKQEEKRKDSEVSGAKSQN